MGRLESSTAPVAPQAYRKDQRAKHARLTINKTIPAIIASEARARRGNQQAELIVDTLDDATTVNNQNIDRKSQTQNDPSVLRICVKVTDTLSAARELYLAHSNSKQNVAILNMASPLRPGGGVLNGATSQEEFLCTRTTLLPSLQDKWYRLPELGAIWSPDVCVFRVPGADTDHDEELGKVSRFYVDTISAGMLRFPELTAIVTQQETVAEGNTEGAEEKVYASPKDRETALSKMRTVMRILKAKGCERVILGAWGCGAYGNPVGEIARAWKKVLVEGSKKSRVIRNNNQRAGSGADWAPLKEVIFAIRDANVAQLFADYWGSGIELEMRESRLSDQNIESKAEQDMEEHQAKLTELQLHLAQVKTPLLRAGIEDAVRALESQVLHFETADSRRKDHMPEPEYIT
ncbi:hypothetical protein EJ08DRAFT_594209 [Tothia fuscella]|uniref:Microbial-type PARG catalytic domain-containing protein n=1 Tax=Tothia fuscella TaxID=1048955 RepID=A0A9P4NKX2_9PEZI|nr:hypothetical protein EJ08DRAFT_594209 [Tothia fuscella]